MGVKYRCGLGVIFFWLAGCASFPSILQDMYPSDKRSHTLFKREEALPPEQEEVQQVTVPLAEITSTIDSAHPEVSTLTLEEGNFPDPKPPAEFPLNITLFPDPQSTAFISDNPYINESDTSRFTTPFGLYELEQREKHKKQPCFCFDSEWEVEKDVKFNFRLDADSAKWKLGIGF